VQLRVFVEAAIDFADEDLELLESAQVSCDVDTLCSELATLREQSAQGVMLRDGIALALLGPPNVGKSSLLNALAGEERAIVTQIPGTTRDLVRVPLNIGGLPVEVVDTAGLRQTSDPVEVEGVRRAREQGSLADVVLWLSDLSAAGEADQVPVEIERDRLILVGNKVDLTDLAPGRVGADNQPPADSCEVRISAATGAGLEALTAAVLGRVGYQSQETAFTARQRHLQALDKAMRHLRRGQTLAASEIELVAEELRLAHLALGEIVGEMTADELLGEIFGTFCVGK
jgi:tRNA modification GTPase